MDTRRPLAILPLLLLVSTVRVQDPAPGEQAEPATAESVPEVGNPDDIGSRCTDCHAELVESYRRTGMARALEPLRPGELSQLAPLTEAATGYAYHFEQGSRGAWIVERRAADAPADGAPPRAPHYSSAPLAFAIGAGVMDRAFAAEVGDRLWFSPLEVIEAHGDEPRHVAFAPGHQTTPGTRLRQPITAECLACHTDRLPPRDFPLNRMPAPEVWSPRGIGCAACHGEVDAHVAWREADLLGEDPPGSDPVIGSDSLDATGRLSVCAGCHLQGDARIELDAGRLGPVAPGGDLLGTRAVFVAAEQTDDIGFVSQTLRMTLSPCFLESRGRPGGGLLCESCHDPHYSLTDESERARVRGACTGCHAEEAGAHRSDAANADTGPSMHEGDPACSLARRPADRDCVDCHMRRTPVFDVGEVEIHDHFIRRDPGPPSRFDGLRTEEARHGQLRRFRWPGEGSAEDDPGLLMMALYKARELQRARELIDRKPGARARRLAMYHHVRASLLEGAGRREDARQAYKRALLLDPELAESTTNLGLLLGRLGRPAEGIALLDELLERHPSADGALRNRALLRRGLGDVAGFVSDLQAAFELLPRAELAGALAAHFDAAGDASRAERWMAEARRLDPLRYP